MTLFGRLSRLLLSFYLITLGVLQLFFYSQMPWDWSFYHDPRIGLGFFLDFFLFGRPQHHLVSSWASAVILSCIGGLLAANRITVRVYLAAEGIMALPNVAFYLWIIWANLSPSHGFSISELRTPLIVFQIYTVIPVVWAVSLLPRKPAGQAWYKQKAAADKLMPADGLPRG